jgi:hypothetical protein
VVVIGMSASVGPGSTTGAAELLRTYERQG